MLAMTKVPPGMVGPAGWPAAGLAAGFAAAAVGLASAAGFDSAGLAASAGFAGSAGLAGALVGAAAGCCPEQAASPSEVPTIRRSRRRRPIVVRISVLHQSLTERPCDRQFGTSCASKRSRHPASGRSLAWHDRPNAHFAQFVRHT